jgi:four helix bundle protein
MTNDQPTSEDRHMASTDSGQGHDGGSNFDLAERTARFGEAVIRFVKSIPPGIAASPVLSQLVRAGTSIGANFCEADEGVSKKDFRNKIGICKKESRETLYWLRMVVAAEPGSKDEARSLWREARELHLILCAIFRRSGPKK